MNPDRKPVPVALGLCLLNWLIPGAGFLAARDFRRGIVLFVLLNALFFLGLAYGGYLTVPALPRTEGFNIVALLTFLVQACHGGGCALILVAQKSGGALGGVFAKSGGASYSDLGAFHFLVAGGLNYFATMRLYDLLAGDSGETDKSSTSTEETTKEEPAGGAA